MDRTGAPTQEHMLQRLHQTVQGVADDEWVAMWAAIDDDEIGGPDSPPCSDDASAKGSDTENEPSTPPATRTAAAAASTLRPVRRSARIAQSGAQARVADLCAELGSDVVTAVAGAALRGVAGGGAHADGGVL